MSKLLKLKYRILLGYSVPIFLSLGVAGIVQYNVGTVAQVSTRVKLLQSSIIKIDEMVLGIAVMVRNTRGYTLFPGDQSYKASYQEGVELFNQASTSLEELIQDPQERELMMNIRRTGEEIDKASRRVFDLLDKGQLSEAVNVTQSIRGLKVSDWREQMLAQANNQLTAQAKQQEAAMYLLSTTVWLGAVLSAILATVVGLFIASRISQTVNETATTIANFSSELATTTEEQERIASQQAVSVNQTTTTMDELGAAARQAAEQAEAAATGVYQALALVTEGTKAVGQTIEGMATLKERAGATAQQILQLSEQTNQIGSIINLVSDIANQTNMLALNAAVEAVRAGEHGKGFAVVAGEIRKLADQSKTSAQRINALILDIQTAITSTVLVNDEGTKTVEEGVKIAHQTGEAFTGVKDAISQVVVSSQEIALGAKQQAIAIQQVVEAMNLINTGAQQTATSISQTKVGTQQLNQVALNLSSVV